MSDYEEKLIIEIFTRLPPKSLLQFRSLSKSWYAIISSPSFIRMHTFRSPQKLLFKHVIPRDGSFYTLHAEDQMPERPNRAYIGITPTKLLQTYGYVVGSCNGIFCVKCHQNDMEVSLWNPSIRRKLILPNFRSKGDSCRIGFGYDSMSDDYKIVGIYYREREETQTSFVYSVKTGTRCPIASPTPLYDVSPNPHFFNGVLHWVVEAFNINRPYILTFDLSSHVFGKISLPEPSPSHGADAIATIQGSLAVIVNHFPEANESVTNSTIWLRKDGFWSVIFRSQAKIGIVEVSQLTNNGDLLIHFYEEGVQVYNPTEMEVRSTLVEFNGGSHIEGMFQYVESLHLLDMGTPYEGNKPPFPVVIS